LKKAKKIRLLSLQGDAPRRIGTVADEERLLAFGRLVVSLLQEGLAFVSAVKPNSRKDTNQPHGTDPAAPDQGALCCAPYRSFIAQFFN
jgi:hypothetical protein